MKVVDNEVKKIMREHHVSYKTGFLAESPLSWLPAVEATEFEEGRYFSKINIVSCELVELIKEREVAKTVKELWVPTFSFDNLERPVINLLSYLLTRITHALFNEILPYQSVEELKKDKSIKHLLPQLAIPLWKLHKLTGINPTMSYCLYSLCNCRKPDENKPLSLNNIELIYSFTDTLDEKSFVWIHQIMEIMFALAIPAFLKAYLLCKLKSPPAQEVSEQLRIAAKAQNNANDVLERMRENCDYETYYKKIRLFYSFPRNVVFDGVEELDNKPQEFLGETGGQSPFMHFRLVVLGADHKEDEYFPKMREHMPREFRELIELVHDSKIREFVLDQVRKNNMKPLRQYNAFLNAILDGRAEHISLVRDYIAQYGEVYGTGKPPLTWLDNLYNETKSKLIFLQ